MLQLSLGHNTWIWLLEYCFGLVSKSCILIFFCHSILYPINPFRKYSIPQFVHDLNFVLLIMVRNCDIYFHFIYVPNQVHQLRFVSYYRDNTSRLWYVQFATKSLSHLILSCTFPCLSSPPPIGP